MFFLKIGVNFKFHSDFRNMVDDNLKLLKPEDKVMRKKCDFVVNKHNMSN